MGAPPAPATEERVPPPPPLAPLSPEAEAARERAKEPGVLRGTDAQPGAIYEVRIVGARKVEADAVLVNVHARVDRAPDQRTIQGDVRRIFQMGVVSDVIVRSLPGPNGSVLLRYELKEKPAIVNVLFDGNDGLSTDDLKEVVDLKPFQVLDRAKIQDNVEKLQKLYVDKGFFLAQVRYELRSSTGKLKEENEDGIADLFEQFRGEQPGRELESISGEDAESKPFEIDGEFVDVAFLIEEQAKVRVEDIRFVGNENISEDELKNALRTREAHPLGILTEWGTYKEELAEIDLLAVEAVYQDRGYINVRVGQPRVRLSADKTRMAITIPIEEGTQFTLSSFDVAGDLLVEDPEEYARIRSEEPDRVVLLKSEILERTRVRAGELFARSAVAQDVLNVADRYRNEGYAYVNIAPETRLNEADRTIALVLQIEAGPRVTIERIEISGNTKTQDRVIRRELRVYEGEFYSAAQLKLSEQRATALGFFEKVGVTTRQGSESDRMVVVFDVKEKSTGTFQLGAGFSNAENFIFQGQIAQNNFLGRGLTLSGSVQWSAFRNIVDLRYVDPYFLYVGQEPLTFAFTAFNTQRDFIEYLRNSTGGELTFGYPLGRPLRGLTRRWIAESPADWRAYVPDFENFQLFLTYGAERVVIDESRVSARLLGLTAGVPRYTTSLRTSLIFDQRNNRLFPSQGYYASLQAELASPYLGSALLPSTESTAKSSLEEALNRQNPLRFLSTNGTANEFTRLGTTLRGYFRFDPYLPVDGVVLKGNLELGWLLTDDPSLIFERYYLGGFNTIRGYFLRSIGPVARVGGTDPSAPLQEFRTGGDKQLISNVELEFPIFEQVGIRGVFFYDAGNAYGPDENFFYVGNGPTPFLQNASCAPEPVCWDPRAPGTLPLGLYHAVGFGVRWFSPIGPLRFEWGVPLTPRPVGTFGLARGDQPVQFEFNIGNSL
ncbi:MAG: outer membrane protein assembly factor BamA [Myxococcota bacterium]